MFDGWPPPVLDPAGPYATSVTLLSWILFALGTIVLIVVLIALYLAVFGLGTMQFLLTSAAGSYLFRSKIIKEGQGAYSVRAKFLGSFFISIMSCPRKRASK